ncbi:MAG TPA: BamA/TamA family outer membrane protein [Gemmatimonadales bacterium]|nr:BamA/TamA family outer membrane protein [Gemmatimonadales bacterium]
MISWVLRRSLLGGLLPAACTLLGTTGVAAQDSIPFIRPRAQVGSIDFRFQSEQSFSTSELGGVIALKGRGSLYGVRQLIGKLPFIGDPATYRFDPVELQKDVVRLRRFYERSGFLDPDIDYRVEANSAGTLVDVTFLIHEGPAVALRELRIHLADSVGLPDSLGPEWKALQAEVAAGRGRRFGEAEEQALERQVTAWLRDRGYPRARARAERRVQTGERQVDVSLEVDPDGRYRLGTIAVDGDQSVTDRVVTRMLPFRSGDWYSASALRDGRTRLQQIDLFPQVVVDIDSAQTSDSILPVRVQIQEAHPRLALAELGYISEGAGFTGRVQWNHPNFTGGARSLTASIEAQSGAGAIGTEAERLLRGSLNLSQPYVFAPRFSLLVGPFAEYRDDLSDRSAAIGLSTTLLYRIAPLSSIALQYQFSARRIYEYRFGDVSAGISLSEFLVNQNPALIDSLGRNIDKSSLTLTGSFSRLDDLANPRRGWLLRPSAELTVPAAFTTVQFARLDLSASGFYPLGRKVVLASRISAGRLFPFGKSVPAPGESSIFSFIRLRDESMTAGGTNDVRGWSSRQLGPKFPQIEARIEGSDTIFSSDQYVPVGALARLSGSLELRLPAPGLPSAWGVHLFLDGGKVWTPDDRFVLALPVPQDTDFHFSTGAGVSYQTPVGAVRLSLGYKLNPSELDLRDSEEVLNAVVNGLPVSSVEPDWSRRLHLHLSLGLAL